MNQSTDHPALTRLELSELETFLWVVREGSFSDAARKLHLSQPAVTNRIKRLEDKLRTKLLQRTTRQVTATPEGIRLRDAAETALAGLRDVMRQFQKSAETGRHRIVVACTPMLAATVLPPLIHDYQQRYPDIQVVLRDLPYAQVVQAITQDAADFAVAALDTKQRGLQFQSLAEEKVLLVVPTGHPLAAYDRVTLSMIAPYRIMFLDRYLSLRKHLTEEFAKQGLAFEHTTASTLPTLLGMIDAGNCVTFLPRTMVQRNAQSSRVLIEIQDLDATRHWGCILSRRAELSAAALAFKDYLRKHFREQLAEPA
ncbi:MULTISPECIES: LysR family transcriptional regulator [Achromobacter]|uniref:HTH-type transcriptional regulator GltC n=1 Tax=Achromobacter piechaudii TaxID=72556 RepID=A0A6S7C9S7_9BURK|nr:MULTISPECIES: LysR family transcriptional regulator [Achromobacter]MPS78562.1 LysR family transcriptional regulator [Achromobacter sp.]CAB3827294.1 HTH-type transcriptional regulator GltC [Achromobacter piechaudii]